MIISRNTFYVCDKHEHVLTQRANIYRLHKFCNSISKMINIYMWMPTIYIFIVLPEGGFLIHEYFCLWFLLEIKTTNKSYVTLYL